MQTVFHPHLLLDYHHSGPVFRQVLVLLQPSLNQQYQHSSNLLKAHLLLPLNHTLSLALNLMYQKLVKFPKNNHHLPLKNLIPHSQNLLTATTPSLENYSKKLPLKYHQQLELLMNYFLIYKINLLKQPNMQVN